MTSQSAGSTGRPRLRHGRRWGLAPVVLVMAALSATACSGSSSSTAAPNPATTRAEVTTLYTTFFSLSNKSVPAKLALLQDGPSFKTAEIEAINFGSTFVAPGSNSGRAKGVTVQWVKLLSDPGCKKAIVSAPCAEVDYSIVSTNGENLLPDLHGYAVYVNGRWLVAKTTLCGLFRLIDLTQVRACAN